MSDAIGTPRISVVIPVLNDAPALAGLLARLGEPDEAAMEVIVVDGGSQDDSAAVAQRHGARLVRSRSGRGFQLAEGVSCARGPWIWMLHADSDPAPEAIEHLCARAAHPDRPAWGRFRVTFRAGPLLEMVAHMMSWRSRFTGICTGDQGIFVHGDLLERAGGVPRQSLMEDIELSKRLKRRGPPECRREFVAASPRRWQTRGTLRTILSQWQFRLRYWLGADPERLAREYYRP